MFHVIVTVRRDDVELVGVEIWGLPSHYQSIIVNIYECVCVCARSFYSIVSYLMKAIFKCLQNEHLLVEQHSPAEV